VRTGDGHVPGRAAELAAVQVALTAASEGRGQVVAVTGRAGAGVTTVLEAALGAAARTGAVVAGASAVGGPGDPPLRPWREVLHALDGPDGSALVGDRADRHRMADDVVALLAARAGHGPVALALDDLHVADTASVLLARAVARAMEHHPVVLLVGWQVDGATGGPVGAQPPAGAGLAALATRHLALGPLDEDAVAAMLARLGATTDPEAVRAVHATTGGVPLLVALLAGSSDDLAEQVPAAPCRPGDVIAALDTPVRDALGAAALWGPEVDPLALGHLIGQPPPTATSMLRPAEDVGVLARTPRGALRFTHELLRCAAAGALDPIRRRDLHAAAAARLAAHDSLEARTARAHHALAATPSSSGDTATIVTACREAAALLVAAGGAERAVLLLRGAEAVVAKPSTAAVEVLADLADASLDAGQLTPARAAAVRAAAMAEEVPDAPVGLRARALLGPGALWRPPARGTAARRRYGAQLVMLLDDLGAGSPVSARRARLRQAALAVDDGAPLHHLEAALTALREVGDGAASADELVVVHRVLTDPIRAERRAEIADELEAWHRDVGSGVPALLAAIRGAVDGQRRRPVRPAPVEQLLAWCDAWDAPELRSVVGGMVAAGLLRHGRLRDAERAAEAAAKVGVAAGDPTARLRHASQLLTIHWLEGRSVEAAPLLADVAGTGYGQVVGAVVAAGAAESGDLPGARARLDAVVAAGVDPPARSQRWLTALACMVAAARVLGDADLARRLAGLLAPYADHEVVPAAAVTCLGSVRRWLGLADLAAGDADRAVDHLEAAVTADRRAGNRAIVALDRADLAEALLARGRPGDVDLAVGALHQAAKEARSMGMAQRAEQWWEAAGALVDRRDPGAALLRHEGDRWTVRVGDHHVIAPDLIGFRYLALLLERPGQDVTALELVRDVELARGRAHAGPPSIEAYRRRVREIDEELADIDVERDVARVERLRGEREALRRELLTVLGMVGGERAAAGPGEQARTTVDRAVERALESLAAADAELANELRSTVVTGPLCRYAPTDGSSRRWEVELVLPDAEGRAPRR
jgi:hypothetical protein